MRYLDFDLELSMVETTVCRVRACSPNWGTVSEEVEFDPTDSDIVDFQRRLATGDVDRSGLQVFGTTLFETLFPRNVAIAFGASFGDARARADGLRVRLAIKDGILRSIPWEYAYFPLRHRFLGADVLTPVTRHLDTFAEAPRPPVETTIRVLVVAPLSQGIDVDREIAALHAAVEPIGAFVDVEALPRDRPVTWDRLCDRLTTSPPHILHFIGHGAFRNGRGALHFNDERGGVSAKSDQRLAALLMNTRQLRLVVLNSCEGAASEHSIDDLSGVAQHLVGAGVPAVLAHRYPIRDDHAIELSATFYSSLFMGADVGLVEAALARARSHIGSSDDAGSVIGTSVLYVRSTGPLFRLVAPDDDAITQLQTHLRSAEQVCRLRETELSRRPSSALRGERLREAESEVAYVKALLQRARCQQAQARALSAAGGLR